ncbi:hypothetical protein, partial [Treponema pedis]|uniref:hypothetical protein n=1 Tax=Treponema pedis TaxID=409322 RepID=UPI003D21E551
STVVQIIQDVDLLCLIRNNHITKLQSGCRGQVAPPFKQMLCGRPHWGAICKVKKNEKSI